jgi:spore coat polysaccharide biosynthesis predicted glycosyltransferase SpsG
MTTVLFVCNGDQETGFGHVSRCLNIASELLRLMPNLSIQFHGHYGDFAGKAIRIAGFDYINSDELPHLEGISLVFVDDYHITEARLSEFKRAGCAIGIIDDFDDFCWPCIDLIINFRFLAEELYQGSDKHLLGLKYFPIKSSLIKLRESRLEQQYHDTSLRNILIFISGTESGDSGKNIILALDEIVNNSKIYWLTTANDDIVLKHNTLQKMDYVNDMYELYKDVDVVISGGGLSKYEAGFCMIPNAAISQTEMQQQDTDVLAQHNLCFDLGMTGLIDQDKLQESITQFLTPHVLNEQLNALKTSYDSQSLYAVASKVLALI